MNQKHVFWEALLLAIFIFAAGIFIGYLIELNRTSQIITSYQEAELNLLDIQIQQELLSLGNFDCNQAVKQIMEFADRTYYESLTLEKYSNSAKIGEGIVFQHKKYDLLRAILWINSMKIKNKCNNPFHTVVYLYNYETTELDLRNQEIESTQRSFSKYLTELKNTYGNKILLIPMAGNLNITSIELIKENYGINSLPVVIVDEKLKVESLEKLGEIGSYLD